MPMGPSTIRGFNNKWSWNQAPAGNCPDTALGKIVFGKSCTEKGIMANLNAAHPLSMSLYRDQPTDTFCERGGE